MDELDRVRELRRQGFFCSQIMLIMGMELQGKENPDLVRAMNGLAGGIGFTGETCGALTGGACLLGLYAGKGTPEQEEDPRLLFMAEELVRWFKDDYGAKYGGIRCEEILNGDRNNMSLRCPQMVMSTFEKVKALLVENGFDLAGEAW
jgi:C_GCAxxG_C_C family probable redox protein